MKKISNYLLNLVIEEKSNDFYKIKIIGNDTIAYCYYNPYEKALEITTRNKVGALLEKNFQQFKKMLVNKRMDTFYPGFELPFVIMDNKPVTTYQDRGKIIIYDRSGEEYFFDIQENSNRRLTEAYTDGSYSHQKKKGGYAVLIKDTEDNYNSYTYNSNLHKSSLIELQAAIKAMELLEHKNEYRIITDSVYVVKGITEWLPMWKLNDWLTCNGEKVKNIAFWKQVDQLTKKKYIELKWVKGHSDHFENSICDLLAKEMANS